MNYLSLFIFWGFFLLLWLAAGASVFVTTTRKPANRRILGRVWVLQGLQWLVVRACQILPLRRHTTVEPDVEIWRQCFYQQVGSADMMLWQRQIFPSCQCPSSLVSACLLVIWDHAVWNNEGFFFFFLRWTQVLLLALPGVSSGSRTALRLSRLTNWDQTQVENAGTHKWWAPVLCKHVAK